MTVDQPTTRPRNPHFSSGPCSKRPGWSLDALSGAMLGRSHRAPAPKARLEAVIDLSRAVLGIPDDYRLAIVPASDTGAIEMAIWSLLGPRPVDVVAFESFGDAWAVDIADHLKLPDMRVLRAPYGALPDLGAVDPGHDVVFTWNGTTSGVRVPDGDWIADDRTGLTLCDATSAAFAMNLPWPKLDVVTWSWQKALGGEAAHGMIALSPRAVERLRSHRPAWPLPKIFRMTSGGQLAEGLFRGETINTPSMLCVEDALDGLRWAERIGGLPELIRRSEANLAALTGWVERTPDVAFLAKVPAQRSCTSICLRVTAPWFTALPGGEQMAASKRMAAALEREGAALDVAPYRDAPPGLRVWGGATVETADLQALTPWIDWVLAAERAAAR